MQQLGREERDGGPRWYAREQPVDRYTDLVEVGLFDVERHIVRKYFTDTDGRVLDLGCGAGRTTSPLYETGFDAVGVDRSGPMVERARSLFPEIPFFVGDATTLPFGDEEFEYVLFSYNGIDYIEPECGRYEAFREIRRVLKPGGLLAFSTHNTWRFPLPDRTTELRCWGGFLYFWVRNAVAGRLLSPYRIPAREAFSFLGRGGAHWTDPEYHINPLSQRRQLRQTGFEPLETVSPFGLSSYTADWLYYVATKRETDSSGKPIPSHPLIKS